MGNRIPVTETEVVLLIEETRKHGQPLKFALGSGDLILPAPQWALDALKDMREAN